MKVGFSADPASRLNNLQTGSPYRLTLIHKAAFLNAYEVEQEAHRLLKPHRVLGGHFSDDNEWFAVDNERAIAAIYGAASKIGQEVYSADADVRIAQYAIPDGVKAFLFGWLVLSIIIYAFRG